MRLLSALFLTVLVVSGTRVFAQANVIENEPSVLYVAPSGSNTNPGTATAPFKTIQAAVNKANGLNKQGIGVRIIVNAGTYRESVTISSSGSTSAPLTVQAAVTGTAIVAGSNVLSGWTSAGNGIYSHSWTNQSVCGRPSGWPTWFNAIALHTEMLFVNGRLMTQALSASDLRPGTFYAGNGTVELDPPAGTNMATALVEGTARAQVMGVFGRSHVVLRGLVFEHGDACINNASVSISGVSQVLLDSVQSRLNNWGGLGVFSSTNVTIKNSVSSWNGGVGIMTNRDVNIALVSNETDLNNWRGGQAALYDWGMGGVKFFQTHGATVENQFSYNNQAQGLWFDTDNKNITVADSVLAGNVMAGLQIERNEGPISLATSYLCGNGPGVNLLTSEKVTVKNNVFYANGGTNKYQAQIYVGGQAGGRIISDWQTGASYNLLTTGMVLSGNVVVDSGAGQQVIGTYLNSTDWNAFANSLSSDQNHWFDPLTANAFKIANGKLVTLATWRADYGTDVNSSWTSMTVPPVACLAPALGAADFQAVLSTGQVAMTTGAGSATVNVRSFGAVAVNLSLKGLPAGVSASFSQNNLVAGMVTVKFAATSAAVTKTVPVTLWAVSGSLVHSVIFNLSVKPL